jgi:hypothetical protein
MAVKLWTHQRYRRNTTLNSLPRTWICLPLAAIPLTLGCGGNGPARYEVSGQIAYDGQPVDNGDIIFSPVDRATGIAVGSPIIDGRYEIDASSGLIAGKYTVDITAQRPSGKKNAGEGTTPPTDLMEQYIPDIYNEATTLEVEITEDRDDLDFNLEKVASTPRRR